MADKSLMHAGLIAILAVVVLSACSPKIRTTSRWQPSAVVIDKPATWHEPAAYNSETGIAYGISNDSDYLYIHLQMDKPGTQMKMLRAGMELSIDTLGKKKGHCTIIFPESQERSLFAGGSAAHMEVSGMSTESRRSSGSAQAGRTRDQQDMVRRLIEQKDRMRVTGFRNHPAGWLPLSNEGGIMVHLALDSVGRLSYRAIIPISTFYKTPLAAADFTKDFSLLITINGLDMPGGQPAGMARGAGNPGSGGMTGRPTGGGMSGGGTYQGRSMGGRSGGASAGGDYQAMTKKETLKVVFSLSD